MLFPLVMTPFKSNAEPQKRKKFWSLNFVANPISQKENDHY